MLGLRYRPGCIADVQHASHLLQQEHALGTRVCAVLPDLVAELLKQHVVKSYVIQENGANRLRWFGLSGFVLPRYLSIALRRPEVPFRRLLLEAALDGATPFLTPGQVASANTSDNLLLTVLVCQPDVGEYTQQEGGLLFRMAYESFCFAHAGYGLAEFWQEVADTKRCEVLQGLGLVLHRSAHSEDGTSHYLLRYDRKRALANPALAMSLVFNRVRPRFAFSPSQQQLLESALLDVPDREFATKYGVSEDAVKKRWRAIYDNVAVVEPELAQGPPAGANQRRALLGYLRQHLEEIRPYRHAAASRASAVQIRSAAASNPREGTW